MSTTSSATPTASLPTIPGYEILGPIGRGGMGEVVLARQANLGRMVAVKWFATGPDPVPGDWLARFRREAELMARVSHPNVLVVHDFGVSEGRPYLILEYVAEGDLRHLLRRPEPLAIDAVRTILSQVCSAVGHLHDLGIVHRDLKPENILMKGGRIPKVADFGIADLGRDARASGRPSAAAGTPEYAAPEQRYGLPVDERSDQYALGVLAYELLTGEKPLGRFPAPSERNPRLSEAADRVILQALSEAPEERYRSVAEFWRALDEAFGEAGGAKPKVVPVEPRPTQRRSWALAVLGVIAAVGGLVVWLVDSFGTATPEPNRVHLPAPPEPAAVESDPVTEQDLVDLWAYLLWLDEGSPTGAEGEQLRGPNHQQAQDLVRKELEALAFDIWKARGSLEFPDPGEAKAESDRNWHEAHERLYERLKRAIRVKGGTERAAQEKAS